MKKVLTPKVKSDFLIQTQQVIRDVLLSIYKERAEHNDIYKIITNNIGVESLSGNAKNRNEGYEGFLRRSQKYLDSVKDLTPEQLLEFTRIDAKSNQLGASARKLALTISTQKEHELNEEDGGLNADKILLTLKKFEQNNVTPKKAQEYLDNLIARFSITGHPTNSTDVEHTKELIDIENLLSDKNTTKEQLKKAFEEYLDLSVASHKKSPAEEVQEAINILDNVYDISLVVRKNISDALLKTTYSESVAVNSPVINACIWPAGDGDGNENYTTQVLQDAYSQVKDWIKNKYAEHIDSIKPDLTKQGLEAIGSVEEKILNSKYKDTQSLQDDVGNILINASSDKERRAVYGLLYQINSHGLHGAKIDIRHDGESIRETLSAVLSHIGIDGKELKNLSAEERQKKLTELFSDQKVIDAISKIDPSDLITNEGGEKANTAARILGRMKTAAQNPEMHDKFIISEWGGLEDVQSLMILLKGAGHKIAEKGALIDIVPLCESADDFRRAKEELRKMAREPNYAMHVNERGRQIFMAAESDTRRKDGYGAGEIVYESIGEIIKDGDIMKEEIAKVLPKGTPLKFKGTQVFNGGGADMVRGAQTKPTEFGLTQAYFAKKHGATGFLGPIMTFQGHQNKLLLSSKETGAYIVEGIISQNLYAAASLEGLIPSEKQTVEHEMYQTQARKDAVIYHSKERDEFKGYSKNPSFDNLMQSSGQWVSTILGNLSSRPSKRGQPDKEGPQKVSDIIGGSRSILAQRAITASNLMRLSGAFSLSLLGEKEALEKLEQVQIENGRPLNNMYQHSKPDRNHLRAIATLLHGVSFGKLWLMSGMERPSSEKVTEIGANFDKDKENDPLTTLCWMEQYAHDTAKLVLRNSFQLAPSQIKELTGIERDDQKNIPRERMNELNIQYLNDKFEGRNFNTKDALRMIWPEAAVELERTYQRIEFADILEADLNKKFNSDPNMVLTEEMIETIRNLNASTSLRNVPEGMLAVQSALGLKESNISKSGNIRLDSLELPNVLKELAREQNVEMAFIHSPRVA